MEVLAIIPARGGSKGILRKNLQCVGGRPLIDYSIKFAVALLSEGAISHHIVSTDDHEIASKAQSLGGNIPFLRPKEIADDNSIAGEYVRHALMEFERSGKEFDAVLILQPTSPLRDLDLCSAAIREFKQNDFTTMISCYREDYVCDEVIYFSDGKKRLVAKSELHNKGLRRQEHGACFVRNGAFYLFKSEFFKSTGTIICDSPAMLEMSKYESVNIDTLEDLEYLRRRFSSGS